MDKPKPTTDKAPAAPVTTSTPVAPISTKVPPLFRRIDWMTCGLTFLAVFIGYFLTLAPEMTLEDSGELAVASYYAGIPHPPGYPVWTIYTHLWAILLPVGNIAWRVGLGVAFSGAVACGLLGLVVSRGSSMLIESIDDLKNLSRKVEGAICLVAGFVAGTLIGFNGYMWSQSVIVEVYPLSVLSLIGVIACLMRWMYAPQQHRYLYWAFFLYGICVNNHQSLLVIAMGMQVLIWLAEPKLGREFFFWNTLIWALGLLKGPSMLKTNTMVLIIYNIIGIASLLLWLWLIIKTQKKAVEFIRDAAMLAVLGFTALFFLGITNYIPKLNSTGTLVFLAAAVLASGFFLWQYSRTTAPLGRQWWHVLACGFSWVAGMAFYLFMPISGATNPPMQWGYPRTLDGFIHAFTRGQYEKIRPTSGTGDNIFEVLGSFFERYFGQLWRFLEGLSNEFGFLYLLIALVVFLFFIKLKRRERVMILGMLALFVCTGPFLVWLLNFSSDRQSLELNRVFLTSAHVFVAMSVGFGLSLIAASLAVHFDSFRKVALLGGVCALDFAFFALALNAQTDFDPDLATKYGYIKVLCWLVAISAIIVLWRKGLERDRLLSIGIPSIFLTASVVLSCLTVFGDPWAAANLGKTFASIGGAFSPDQYGLPIFAALILLGAGLVFVAAVFISKNRAPMAVTLGVFALMPSYSVMTHWFENEQRNHWFGYWFGHDMFTPPYKAKDGTLKYDAEGRKEAMAGPNGKLVYPEMDRHTILFGGTDPGRFAPTYMIFADSFIPNDCKPEVDPVFDRRDVYIITQNALADGTYLQYIRAHYFRSDEYQYDTPFFQQLLRGPEERDPEGTLNYQTNILARLAYRFLDKPLTDWGARVEARRRKEGVYPSNEIYTPTPQDSQRCFQLYIEDAQRRLMHDQQFPNEPRQLRPGEDVIIVDNRVQVSGQVAVMAINGLLTKVIFDKNPTNEFYVEESFPLDWMFPHLTPFGIIMKINRQPLPELTEEIIQRDHQFWKDYSTRLIGDWIDYDTPVKEVAKFAEQVYMKRNFAGFKGDRRFVRDDQAQKAFSKLRSSIGGVYAWRLGMSSGAPTPVQYVAQGANRDRMIREAEFAFKQAFAFCPYSPEAVFRYVQLLATLQRMEDALAVAETCLKLDPYNPQVRDLVQRLRESVNPGSSKELQALEKEVQANPENFQKAFDLAQRYMNASQMNKAMDVLDKVVSHPRVDAGIVFQVAQLYLSVGAINRAEPTLEKLVKLAPNEPVAWYNLALGKASIGKSPEAIEALRRAVTLGDDRRKQDKNMPDIRAEAAKEPRFQALRNLPEYKALMAP